MPGEACQCPVLTSAGTVCLQGLNVVPMRDATYDVSTCKVHASGSGRKLMICDARLSLDNIYSISSLVKKTNNTTKAIILFIYAFVIDMCCNI